MFSPRRWPALLLLVVALAVAGSCSDGDDDDKTAATATTPEGQPAPLAGFAFSLTGADVHAANPQAPPFPEDVKGAVKASLDAWLSRGIVLPLRTGQPPAGLEGVLTGAAAGRLVPGQPDRAAVLEEGTPVSGKVTQDRANAKLTALLDPGGAVAVVTAQVDLGVTVKGKGTTLKIARAGEIGLVFDNNAWRIDSYDLRTARDTT